jgi:hypothetical protein
MIKTIQIPNKPVSDSRFWNFLKFDFYLLPVCFGFRALNFGFSVLSLFRSAGPVWRRPIIHMRERAERKEKNSSFVVVKRNIAKSCNHGGKPCGGKA